MSAPTEFKKVLAGLIGEKIKELLSEETTGISARNLQQITATPHRSLAGAPSGINAAAQYSEIFKEVLSTVKLPSGFEII